MSNAGGLQRLPQIVAALVIGLQIAVAGPAGLSENLLDYVSDNYGRSARERLLAWERLMESSRTLSEREKLERVNRFFNRLQFVDDDEHWGRRDYWATPVEFLSTAAGDCEDFSVAKYFTLKEIGVPVDKMRLTYVKSLGLNQAHMVLSYYETPRAEPLILDNLVDGIMPGSLREDLVPVYGFNGDGLWIAVERGEGRRLEGGPRGVRLWKELMARMEEQTQRPSATLRAAVAAE